MAKKRNYELSGTPTRESVDFEVDDPYDVWGDQVGYGRDPEAGYDALRRIREAREEDALWSDVEQLRDSPGAFGSEDTPPELSPEEVKRLREIDVGLYDYDEDGLPKSKDDSE